MITSADEKYILEKAYVPEHITGLMIPISKGEPFLIEDHLGFVKDNWLILVGYPLERDYSEARCETLVSRAVEIYRPEYLWLIAPKIPSSLLDGCTERQSDQYYRLVLRHGEPKRVLQRMVEKASKQLVIERTNTFTKEHRELVTEFLKREKLPPRLRELYLTMPEYVPQSSSSCVLNGRDESGRLSAFYVLELAAKGFVTYLLGCYSRKYYVPHASDLLFHEMINLTAENGKSIINLGLGVNEGIRRFKEKWGGVPYLNYEFCERSYGYTRTVSLIKELEGKL